MPVIQLAESDLTRSVIGAFYDVYNIMGYGFAEYLYAGALQRELITRGHAVGREVSVDVYFKGDRIGTQRLDMLVDGRLVVEVKSSLRLPESASKQVLSYLRSTNLEVGLLLHFGPRATFFRLWCPHDRKGIRYRVDLSLSRFGGRVR